MSNPNYTLAEAKFKDILAGKKVITNDNQLDDMLALYGDKAPEGKENPKVFSIRSIPNPNRVGTKDKYIAWIAPEDLV